MHSVSNDARAMPRGFLLHSRHYRESSLLATFFTDVEGRVDVVFRARRGRGRAGSPLPFCQYELDWQGRGELKSVRCLEPAAPPIRLEGMALYCGLYLNELLQRLLPLHVPEHSLLHDYHHALQMLAASNDVEPVLRCFELQLLDCLGYGLELTRDAEGRPLQPDRRYRYLPEHGLVEVSGDGARADASGAGAAFQAIAARDLQARDVRQLAKRLLRSALAQHLGSRPLHSRSLFGRG